jgi:hypothetical protein
MCIHFKHKPLSRKRTELLTCFPFLITIIHYKENVTNPTTVHLDTPPLPLLTHCTRQVQFSTRHHEEKAGKYKEKSPRKAPARELSLSSCNTKTQYKGPPSSVQHLTFSYLLLPASSRAQVLRKVG